MVNGFLGFECCFWGAIALILYTYAGYPLWMYLRSCVSPRSWRKDNYEPTISIILPVHNAVALVEQQIGHLLSLAYPAERTEVIVVSDGSTDGSNEILGGIQHPRLSEIICPEHRGKAAALNVGMSCASGEILVFVDIRPTLETNALRFLISNFADPSVGCAAGHLILRDQGHDAGTKVVGGWYWRYEQWIRACEAKIDSPLGVYGGFYAMRRRLARPLPDGAILDDMLQPLSVIRQGFRSVLDERALVFDTWPKTVRGEFNRKVRTLAGNFQLLQLAPWLLGPQNRLRWQLISHKLLRLLVPYLLVAAFVSSFLLHASLIYKSFVVIQTLFYGSGILGLIWNVPVLRRLTGPPSAFLLLNTAALVGFVSFVLHRRDLWKIWTQSPVAARAPLLREVKTSTADK